MHAMITDETVARVNAAVERFIGKPEFSTDKSSVFTSAELDISKPNTHDSKQALRSEMNALKSSIAGVEKILNLLSSQSLTNARDEVDADLLKQARSEPMSSAIAIARIGVAELGACQMLRSLLGSFSQL